MRRTMIAAVALLAACADAGGDAATVVVRDSAGVAIVVSSEPSLGEDAWTLSNEPIFQVGNAGGADDYWFGELMGMTRLSDGTVVAADMGRDRLAFYAPDGTFIRSVGREGEGPGEFTQLGWLDRVAGDTLLAADFNGRVHVFDSAGEFARMFVPGQTATSSNGMMLARYYIIGPLDGGSYVVGTGYGIGPDGPPDSTALYRLGPDGTIQDTIARYSTGVWKQSAQGSRQVIFSPEAQMAVANNRLYMGYPDLYRIKIRDREGALLRIVGRALDPEPVSESDMAAYRERYVGLNGEDGRPANEQARARRQRIVEESEFAQQHPVFLRMLADDAGNLWIQERSLAHQFSGGGFQPTVDAPSRWNVFGPDGGWLTSVTLPANFRVFEIGEDYVLGLARDESEVDQVRMYGLRKGL